MGFHSFLVEHTHTEDGECRKEELVLCTLGDLNGVVINLLNFITKWDLAIECSEILDSTNSREEVTDWCGARNGLGTCKGVDDIVCSELLTVATDYVLAKLKGPYETVLGERFS